MMKALEMWAIFETCIADYHLEDHIDQDAKNPHPDGSAEALLYRKAWIDTLQWHLEDEIRAPFIEPTEALILKRRIDKSNQERTNVVEALDDRLLSPFAGKMNDSSLPLNTESPGWAVDRLSILALKVYHMRIEAERPGSNAELRSGNAAKLATLEEQKADLCAAIDQLLADLAAGKRRAKVYRQMKMYNDPKLNPVLYQKKP